MTSLPHTSPLRGHLLLLRRIGEAAAVAAVLIVASLLLATDRPVEAAGPTTLGRTPWQVLVT